MKNQIQKQKGAILASLILCALIVFASCAPKTGKLFYGALGLGEAKIIVTNSSAAVPWNSSVTMYDIGGNFIGVLADFSSLTAMAQSVVVSDPLNLMVFTQNIVGLYRVSLFGGYGLYSQDGNVTGAAASFNYIRKGPDGAYYVSENAGNDIEKFSSSGVRVGSGAAAFVPNIVAGCTNLSAPRSIAFNNAGQLIVANYTANTLNSYNVSSGTATCGVSVAALNSPWALGYNSDTNLLYYTTLNNELRVVNGSTLSSSSTLIPTAGSPIGVPSAVVVMPDGSLLVASQTNYSILSVSSTGAVLNANFIKNAFTTRVTDLAILEGQ